MLLRRFKLASPADPSGYPVSKYYFEIPSIFCRLIALKYYNQQSGKRSQVLWQTSGVLTDYPAPYQADYA